MAIYKNVSGSSGVESYEVGTDFIEVKFKAGAFRFYKYTYISAGQAHVEEMKKLAAIGHGLNAYINGRVKDKFASKK